MKKSVVLAFLFVVTVPLLLVGWFGWRAISAEQQSFQTQLMELQQERLREFSANQSRWITTVESELLNLLENLANETPENWPRVAKPNRFADQVFLIGSDGALLWPNGAVLPLTDNEIHFKELYEQERLVFPTSLDEQNGVEPAFRWTTWFEGPGQQWAFWTLDKRNRIFGVMVDRMAFISEAIAQFPETSESPYFKDSPESFYLVNEAEETLYQWGALLSDPGREIIAETALPEPLNRWRIQLFGTQVRPSAWYGQSRVLLMALSIFAFFLTMMAAAYYLFSETRREFAEARQRVSFVNQVSHEFKTPLTNIQLYAELLEDSMEAKDSGKYLKVIRDEAGKLSRMIQNVLTFARSRKTTLKVHPRNLVPDQQILEQVEIHRPGLERQKISLQLDLHASHSMNLDQEILDQILGNLLSNA